MWNTLLNRIIYHNDIKTDNIYELCIKESKLMIQISETEKEEMINKLKVSLDDYPIVKEIILGKN